MTIPAGLISKALAKAARAKARKEANDALIKKLLTGTEAGRVANGLGMEPTKFQRFVAAFDGDEWGSKLEMAVAQEAIRLRDIMIKSLVEQKGGLTKPFAKLSKATIALRRSKMRKKQGGRAKGTKALIATAQMFKSIQVVRRGKTMFIGIPRTAKTGDQSAANVALIQELGIVRTWSDKQSRWFWWQISKAGNAQARTILRKQKKLRKAKRATKTVRLLIVPPRPFIAPSVEVWQSELGPRLQQLLKPTLVGG